MVRWLTAAAVLAAASAEAQTRVDTWIEVEPRTGQEVTDAGGRVVDILWRAGVEVRARTRSGRALTPAEQASVVAEVVSCGRGRPVDLTTGSDPEGDRATFVVRYACAYLQGPQY